MSTHLNSFLHFIKWILTENEVTLHSTLARNLGFIKTLKLLQTDEKYLSFPDISIRYQREKNIISLPKIPLKIH